MVGRAKPRIVAQAVRHPGDSCRDGSAVGGTFRIVMVDDDSSIVHTGTYRMAAAS